jgi:aromatic-L-amino-acid/L-tryptophan decarboxylase
VEAGYLREAAAGSSLQSGLDGDITFYEYGPQLTRSFRALKLWMFLKTFGIDAVAARITGRHRSRWMADATST